MRSTQFIGLHQRAYDFLDNFARKQEVITKTIVKNHNGVVITEDERTDIKYEQSSENPNNAYALGMFEEKIPLRSFILKDGTVVREQVQDNRWFSGPMISTALMTDKSDWITETLWTEEELSDY